MEFMLLCVCIKPGKLEGKLYVKEIVAGCDYSWTRSGGVGS